MKFIVLKPLHPCPKNLRRQKKLRSKLVLIADPASVVTEKAQIVARQPSTDAEQSSCSGQEQANEFEMGFHESPIEYANTAALQAILH